MGCLNTLYPLFSRKSFPQFDMCSLTFARFLPPEHTACPTSSLKFQPEDFEVTAFELRWNTHSKQLMPSWYAKYLSLLTTWHYLGCIHKYDVIGTHTAKRYSICVSRVSNFYLFIKEKGSVITQLKTDVTRAWGATQNLNFATSQPLNGFILQNCCKFCKTTITNHLQNSREERKMFFERRNREG